MKRTKVDFSKHILTPIVSVDGTPLTFRFADPLTGCYAITFINTCGIMAVTGDCNNWIFCREFHPSAKGYVSDSYWVEKLRIASTQKPSNFSLEETKKEIEERLSKGKDDGMSDEDKDYLNDLLEHLYDGEERYQVYAHDNLPNNRDFEFVPYRTELNPMLEVVFDAFDEICERMKVNK
jgi:hypothetical protein